MSELTGTAAWCSPRDARGELLSPNDVRLDATTLTYTTRVATAPTAAQLAVATYQTGVQTNYLPFNGDDSGGFYGSYLRSDLVNGQATLFGGPEGGLTGTVSVNATTGEVSASYSRAAIDADLTERYGDTLTLVSSPSCSSPRPAVRTRRPTSSVPAPARLGTHCRGARRAACNASAVGRHSDSA